MEPRARWERMYDELDEDGRQFWMAVLEDEIEQKRALPRARLRLIDCAKITSNLTHNPVNSFTRSGGS